MRSYARYWCEAFRLPSMDRAARARPDGSARHGEPMFEALEQGRGVVAALPHSGNWDVAGLWFVETQRRLGRSPGSPRSSSGCAPSRCTAGSWPTGRASASRCWPPATGRSVYRTLVQRLREGGLVCLVADRDLSATGLEVSFFGEPARLPSGPARLAARTGALLVPAFPSFTPDGWAVTMGDPVPVPGPGSRDDVAKATQALADALAALIATAPHDWHMLQRVWTADRAEPGLMDRGGAAADRDRLPVLAGRPRRGAVARPRPRPGTHRARPLRVRPRARRRRARRRRPPAAGVRHPRRPRGQRALQRVRGPDHLRARLLRPRPALARRAHLRRAAPARARHVQPVVAGAVRGRGADRRHVPHLHRAVPRDAWCSPGRSTRSWRRSRRGSRCPRWRGGSRSSTWAATRWRSRTASTCGCSRSGPLLPGYPRDGTRSGSSAGSTSRARAWRCCSTRCAGWRRPGPDLRLLVVGRGDPDALRRAAGPGARRPARHPRRGGRRDEGGGAALDGRLLRAQHRRRELRDGAHRGDGGRSGGAGQRPRRVPGGAVGRGGFAGGSSGIGAGVLFPTGDARGARLRARRAARRPAAPGRPRCGGRARAAAFDWPVVAADVLRVYRAAIAADPRRVPGRTAAGTR